MNILVKHNGTNITNKVISYQREHRICTSIGTLNVTLEGTYSTTIDPWDTIDIHENGDFKVRYYVSDVSHSVPDGTITLQCQDKSKRLVDYFIPDSYTIDYPSTTKYWIQKFLTEAGISYHFTTSSPGNLLSNYTALGLQPAYDQIMLLLQLSGWYMYFDGNGIATIGSLDVDLATTHGSLGKTDILDIKKVSNDKMLRNRALVWGTYDPFRQEYAFADVTKHTRWDYDNRDVRTMVVSNQNIPNSRSAYSIANVLLKEFTKLTVEKHIVAHGARDLNLGNAVRVNSDIWKGKGLITTFGVNMDRNGLVTTLVLDERCPRLFGFFNFGDYVYVGTFGDGVWRKHIKFDPAWYDFSSGLTDLNITDLHINNGIFSAVGHNGAMFYANSEDGPWYEIPTITGLQSSLEDQVDLTVISGIEMTGFSGIMARATIVDKTTNIIKFGVDNWSGLNMGDYFLEYSGLVGFSTIVSGVVLSGVVASGHNRGWLVEYDPYTGTFYTGENPSGVYPISYSGNYDIRVVDLENDGVNDYVSVKAGGITVIEHTAQGYNFGQHTSQNPLRTQDDASKVSFPDMSYLGDAGDSLQFTTGTSTHHTIFDNESIDEREMVYRQSNRFVRRTIDVSSGLSVTTLTGPVHSPALVGSPSLILKLSTDNYRMITRGESGNVAAGSDQSVTYYYVDWNASSNTVSAETSFASYTMSRDIYHGSFQNLTGTITYINNKIYNFYLHTVKTTSPGVFDPDFDEKSRNYIKIHSFIIDAEGLGVEYEGIIFTNEFRKQPTPLSSGSWLIETRIPLLTYQEGNLPHSFFMITETATDASPNYTNWFIYCRDSLNVNITLYESSDTASDIYWGSSSLYKTAQLTGENFYFIDPGTVALSNKGITYNGESLAEVISYTIPWYQNSANIYPLFGNFDNYYIAVNGSDWYFCNPQTMVPEVQLVPPIEFEILKPYISTDTISPKYYWQAREIANPLNRYIVQTNESSFISKVRPVSSYTYDTGKAFIAGNFFINVNNSSVANVLYLNNNMDVPTKSSKFWLLQREGADFNLIREALKPIRVDISNNSPTLTALDVENTFQSSFIFNNEVTTIIPISGLDLYREVRDFRYTSLETTTSGTIVASGAGILTQVLYVTESGVYYSDANAYSGGFLVLDTIASGVAERIETTNYVYPGQYIFVTTSGDNPMFYQKDNDGLFFTAYSGLPDSRATIIRCDDRF